jgi:hypothetical protein
MMGITILSYRHTCFHDAMPHGIVFNACVIFVVVKQKTFMCAKQRIVVNVATLPAVGVMKSQILFRNVTHVMCFLTTVYVSHNLTKKYFKIPTVKLKQLVNICFSVRHVIKSSPHD